MTSDTSSKKELLIIGVHLKSDGYPNVKFRIQDLMRHNGLNVVEFNFPMWTENTQGFTGRRRLLRNFARTIYAHLLVTICLLRRKRYKTFYIPYPSVFVLYIVSLIPFLRPKKIIADVFISLYDTIVLDMKLFAQGSIVSKLLKIIERRAYSTADVIVTDTRDCAEHFAALFDIPQEKIVYLPLSTDEEFFKSTEYTPRDTCRVLFIGTFSDLHNVELIVEAAKLLKDNENIIFRLVGDGHVASRVDSYIKANKLNVEWTRNWLSSAELMAEIIHSDICLGIFGNTDKARRVCPLKVYAYAACGRPIITAETPGMENICSDGGDVPFLMLKNANAENLARAIKTLFDDPLLRMRLAQQAEKFYRARLANRHSLEELVSLIG